MIADKEKFIVACRKLLTAYRNGELGQTVMPEDSNTREEISARWRELLKGTDINPIDMHPPLWFWSHNGFRFHAAL